jgi:hypothetical protein
MRPAIPAGTCALLSVLLFGQQPTCDRGLESHASGPHAYKRRGDRCEGIYVQQVGGTVLTLASLTESFEDYATAAGGPPLTVEWSSFDSSTVVLRAQGIKHDLYYRMDATRAAVPSTYRWPSDVLAARRIPRRDVGVLAWIRTRLGGVERSIYLPLRIGQRQPPARGGAYELVVFPALPLKEVYLTVTQVDSGGEDIRVIHNARALHYGLYPAERPVRVKLDNLGAAGIYRVSIGAELAANRSVSLEQWIYHANGSAH